MFQYGDSLDDWLLAEVLQIDNVYKTCLRKSDPCT